MKTKDENKEVRVTGWAYAIIEHLRTNEGLLDKQGEILESLTSLAKIVRVADDDFLNNWGDDLHQVMYTLTEYADLVSALSTEPREQGEQQ